MRLPLLIALLHLPIGALAHELWIEPVQYSVPSDTRIQARLVNGQSFEGVELPYFPNRTELFRVFNADGDNEIINRIGNRPAIDLENLPDGLNILVYQSKPAELTYAEPEKFTNFIKHKDLKFTFEDHLARGLPENKVTEVYTRFSKSLVGIGSSNGNDKRVGLLTELVALSNPYTDKAPMRVQLFYNQEPRPNAQIEVFERAADQTVQVSTVRTDMDGIAEIQVKPNHEYMLDAVVLRIPSQDVASEYSAMWESLWANLTFFVPE